MFVWQHCGMLAVVRHHCFAQTTSDSDNSFIIYERAKLLQLAILYSAVNIFLRLFDPIHFGLEQAIWGESSVIFCFDGCVTSFSLASYFRSEFLYSS
jgi:hypothetical protein